MQYVPGESGIEALVRFARLASETHSSEEILPLLNTALVKHTGCEAVAIVEIHEHGARIRKTEHTPEELHQATFDPDADGSELAVEMKKATKGRFQAIRVFPLVSSGGLFGHVALFCSEAPHDATLAQGLIDLTAVALASEARLQQLVRSQAELRTSQERLMRTEKLRALGQMAAGISHDLKNILNPVAMHLQVAARAIDRNELEDAKTSIAEMKQIVRRGVETLERLRDYSRQAPESRAEEVDLDKLAHEAIEIARPRMSSRKSGVLSKIVEDVHQPPKVMGRSSEILNALVNLIVNAIDADAKNITVTTGREGDAVMISVRDDGPGMSAEVQARVFDPFFTTKGEEGTGLGLAMAFATMQRHGGSITVDSEVGKGTTFTLRFPLTSER